MQAIITGHRQHMSLQFRQSATTAAVSVGLTAPRACFVPASCGVLAGPACRSAICSTKMMINIQIDLIRDTKQQRQTDEVTAYKSAD